MKKIKCTDLIPEDHKDKYDYDEKGNIRVTAGEPYEVECVCGKCFLEDEDETKEM